MASTGPKSEAGHEPARERRGGDEFKGHKSQKPVLPDKQYLSHDTS